jgi:hypothetical protein
MNLHSLWPWAKSSPGDYKSVETYLNDEEDKYSDQLNGTGLVDSATASSCDHDEEESGCRCSRGQHKSRPVLAKACVGANILLFVASVTLFIGPVYQWPAGLNDAYRQVTTYCKFLISGLLAANVVVYLLGCLCLF